MKVLFLLVVTFCFGVLQACTSENSSDASSSLKTPTTLKEQHSMKIYIDPATGVPTTPPASSSNTLPNSAALNTSSSGLVEKPLPGGGSMIDLQGRFQSSSKATVQKDGSIVIEHQPATNSRPLSEVK